MNRSPRQAETKYMYIMARVINLLFKPTISTVTLTHGQGKDVSCVGQFGGLLGHWCAI